MIISVDAHKNKIALAYWSMHVLTRADLIRGTQRALRDEIRYRNLQATNVVIEKMRIYPNERVKDPNDLLEVSKVVGMCHFLGETVVEYEPREWKGQVPKETHHKRILKALNSLEIEVLGKYIKQKDVLDAIGIGLHYLKRI